MGSSSCQGSPAAPVIMFAIEWHPINPLDPVDFFFILFFASRMSCVLRKYRLYLCKVPICLIFRKYISGFIGGRKFSLTEKCRIALMIYDLFPLFSRVKFNRVVRLCMLEPFEYSQPNIISVHIGAIRDFVQTHRDPKLEITAPLIRDSFRDVPGLSSHPRKLYRIT